MGFASAFYLIGQLCGGFWILMERDESPVSLGRRGGDTSRRLGRARCTHVFRLVVYSPVGLPPGDHGFGPRASAATLDLVLLVGQDPHLLRQNVHFQRLYCGKKKERDHF